MSRALLKRMQWELVLLILLVTAINYLDRSAISFAILPLKKTFGINDQEFGLIAAAFGMGYLAMCLCAGVLIDRFGPFRIWTLCAAIWSLATLLTSQAVGFKSLFFLRLALGLAEAVHFPALLKVIARGLEPRWRSRAIAIGLLGVPVASLIGAPFLSYLIHAFNWQAMFYVLGTAGFVWILLWVFFLWQNRSSFSSDSPKNRSPISYSQIFASQPGLGSCLNFFVFGYILFFALIWLPGYIEETYQTNILTTGWLIAFPWALSIIFTLAGGWGSDFLWKKMHSIYASRSLLIAGGLMGSGFFFLLIFFSGRLELDIALLSLGLGCAFFANAPMYSLNADLFKQDIGKAQGVMTGFFALSGIASPAITGSLVQITGNFKAAIALTAVFSLLACLVALYLQRSLKNQ